MTNRNEITEEENEEKIYITTQDWFDHAVGLKPDHTKILYHKEGGFYWQYRDVRMMVQRTLESGVSFQLKNKHVDELKEINIFNLRALQHYQISEWYVKSLYSLKNVKLLNGAIYHKIAAVNFLDYLIPLDLSEIFSGQYKKADIIESLILYRFNFLYMIILDLTKLIKKSQHLVLRQGLSSSPEDQYNPDSILEAMGLGNETEQFSEVLVTKSESYVLNFVGRWILRRLGWEQIYMQEDPDTWKSFIGTVRNNKDLRKMIVDGLINLCLEFSNVSKIRINVDFDSSTSFSQKNEEIGESEIRVLNESKDEIEIDSKNKNKYQQSKPSLYYHISNFDISNKNFGIESFSNTTEKYRTDIEMILQTDQFYKFKLPNTQKFSPDKAIAQLLDFLFLPVKPVANPHYHPEINESSNNRIALYLQLVIANDSHKSILVTRLISKLLYFYIRQNKVHVIVNKVSKQIIELKWKHIYYIASLTRKLLKVTNADFYSSEVETSQKIITFQAISLAKLGRFYEAHRVLNDATAFVEATSKKSKGTNIAIIRIRRTEVHLEIVKKLLFLKETLKGENIQDYLELVKSCSWFKSTIEEENYVIASNENKNKQIAKEIEHIERIYAVKIEDAQISLTNAEYLLIDNDRSTKWWLLLYLLKLKLFGMGLNENVKIKSIVFSKKIDYLEKTISIYKRGMFLASFQPFMKLRMTDEFYRTIRAMEKSQKESSQTHTVGAVSTNKLNNLSSIFFDSLVKIGYPKSATNNTNFRKKEFREFIFEQSSQQFNDDVEPYFQKVSKDLKGWINGK